MKTPLVILAAAFGLIVGANSAFSQKRYDVGASDTEIRIGNTMPYSGPLSAYALIGRTEEAYFRKLNSDATKVPSAFSGLAADADPRRCFV